MTTTRNGLILALFLSAATLAAGCAGNQGNANTSTNSNSSQSNVNATKTNVEELGVIVNVPYESEEVFWREDSQHKKIVAVLRFPQAEASRLVADAEKIRPPQEASINSETWFPPELVAQGDASADDTLKGKSYAANSFFQDTYNEGRIIKIDDSDYFILELSSK
jgi:hypothetical protein